MKKAICEYFEKKLDWKERLNLIKQVGYDAVILGYYDQPFLEKYEYCKKIGLEISMVHCSYYEPILNNFWLENDLGQKIEDDYIQQIKVVGKLKEKNFIVHLNGSKETHSTLIGLNRIKRLLAECEKYNLNLCLENLYVEDELEIPFREIFHKNLKFCYDTGHENFLLKGSNLLEKFGGFCTALHLHDNDGITDQHKPLWNGNIDKEKLASDLANYVSSNIILSSEAKLASYPDLKQALTEDFNALCKLENLIQKYK